MSFRNEKSHSRAFRLSDVWLFEACRAELWSIVHPVKIREGEVQRNLAKKFSGWESISDDPLLPVTCMGR